MLRVHTSQRDHAFAAPRCETPGCALLNRLTKRLSGTIRNPSTEWAAIQGQDC